jgi:serine/threonine-protein kinase
MQTTQKIEGYESLEKIAGGGMAIVYKAREMSLGKTVAIKMLHPQVLQDPVLVKRFKREVQTAMRVQHDNIVKVIGCGEAHGSQYVVMEYYDGFTLEDLLADQAAVPLDVCFAVILNACYGLEATHSEKLVHGEIRPDNIICTAGGGVKIAGLGLAGTVERTRAAAHADNAVGAFGYMSPERTRGEQVGTQGDIFSLGVVAYELVESTP